MMRWFLPFFLCSGVAHAGSITAAGIIAGPDSSPAKADAAAVHYNPAAIAAIAQGEVAMQGRRTVRSV